MIFLSKKERAPQNLTFLIKTHSFPTNSFSRKSSYTWYCLFKIFPHLSIMTFLFLNTRFLQLLSIIFAIKIFPLSKVKHFLWLLRHICGCILTTFLNQAKRW